MQSPELTSNLLESDNKLSFTLKNIHFSTANALRRTILSDIPVYGIRTETEELNQCRIEINTSRLHNEIIKQRLSCIPVNRIVTKHTSLVKNWREPWDEDSPTPLFDYDFLRYELELDKKNESENEIAWVTTEDFKLRNKDTNEYMTREKVNEIFPPDQVTRRYIDFLRLLPGVGKTIPGEHIKLKADFSVCTAKENGMFNAATICTYHNTIDTDKRDKAWDVYVQEHSKEFEGKPEELKFELENFKQLQGQRYFVSDKKGEPIEFSFVVQSVGIYEPTELVKLACKVLVDKFRLLISNCDADVLKIIPSDSIRLSGIYLSVTESSIPFCFDIVLENEDYTVGCVFEHIMYELFYEGEELLSFIGFKKYHPHDTYSILRVAYKIDTHIVARKTHIQKALTIASAIFESIGKKTV
jgi:hypothetical protein